MSRQDQWPLGKSTRPTVTLLDEPADATRQLPLPATAERGRGDYALRAAQARTKAAKSRRLPSSSA
jgi:hypothetical protein